ncbi:MAG TPA: hypothetical protein VL001_10055 [Candidimonas sp.]|nr:hypothetical protein [Candidimonas sp.]
MKTLHKAILISTLLVTPFVNVQARDEAAHRAWIEAQKIDIKPTLEITETEIPADQAGATNSQMPGAVSPTDTMPTPRMPSSNMPSSNMPSSNMPSSGGYEPAPPSGGTMPQGSAPIESPLNTDPGTGIRPQ